MSMTNYIGRIRVVSDAPRPDVPDNWIVMNAPRPLYGHKSDLQPGPEGLFTVAIDPSDPERVLYQTISQIREVTRASVGSIVGFCRRLGLGGFAELKMKLIGSIVAISGIELLKAFMHVEALTNEQLAWKVGIHMTFVLSGVLFALMDRISADKKGHAPE